MYLFKPFFFTFLLLGLCFFSEGGGLKSICKALEKKDYEKAEKKILKSLKKDSLNPGAKYYLSVLLIQEGYHAYNVDSSWYFIGKAIKNLKHADEGIQKDLDKVGLEEEHFIKQRKKIASLAFDHAIRQMTIPAITKYLENYKNTELFERATFIRDSLAFDTAKSKNRWQGYEEYFLTYPNSSFVPEAKERYQSLIFKDHTKDDKLGSYIQFLKDHPDTPFRRLAEEIIFTRSVLDHQWDSYLSFLRTYPNTHLRKRIGDILYYKSKTDDFHKLEEILNIHSNPDSLHAIFELEKRILFPIFEGGVFGFMSLGQEMILKPQFQSIPDNYLCGNIKSEWLHTEGKIINRKGETVQPEVRAFQELGEGIVLVKKQNGMLHHKSGFRISDVPVENAAMLPQGLISFQSGYDWGLMTFLGHQIVPPKYQSINLQGSFVILEDNGAFKVTSLEQLKSSDTPSFVNVAFDDYEVIGDTLLQGFQGNKECLLDMHLNFLITPGTYSIYISNNSWYVKDNSGYQLVDKRTNELMDQKFSYLNENEGWITLKEEDQWLLISKEAHNPLALSSLDSVRLISPDAAFYKKGDTLKVLFQNGKNIWLQSTEKIELINNRNVSYLLFSLDGYHKLMDASGGFLFDSKNDEISLLGDSTFRFKKNGKVGVLDKYGKVLIPANYNLADEKNGLVFLLKGSEIGCYDVKNNLLIPAVYQAKIFSFGDYHYQVQKQGKVGLVDRKNKVVVPIEYNQLIQWNDTSLWAQKANEWKLVTFDHTVLLENIRSVNIWIESEGETFAIILSENGHGLLSNKSGEILPAEYNDIVNIGSVEVPVFFAEQHLKTASFYVATYLDRLGKAFRSQAFRPEEYERIYCD